MYHQILENYNTKYKQKRDWLIKQQGGYVFYFWDDKYIIKNIDLIIQTQLKSQQQILRCLNIKKYTKQIKYYIYPTNKSKQELMGGAGFAQSVFRDNSVHIVFNQHAKPLGCHEDMHLISLTLGNPTSLFSEGLAEFLMNKENFVGTKRQKYLQQWLHKYGASAIQNYFTQDGWMNYPDGDDGMFYTIAQKWTVFLIESFDKKNYFKLYGKIKRRMNQQQIIFQIEKVTQKKFIDVLRKWERYLK